MADGIHFCHLIFRNSFLRYELPLFFEIWIALNCIEFLIAYHPLYAGKNLRFFEYLQRNFYLRRSSKIFQNCEESLSSSSLFFLNPKILRLRSLGPFSIFVATLNNNIKVDPAYLVRISLLLKLYFYGFISFQAFLFCWGFAFVT